MFCIISIDCLCFLFFVVLSYRPSAQHDCKWKPFLSFEILIPAGQVFGWSFQYIPSEKGLAKPTWVLVGESAVFFCNFMEPLMQYIQTDARNAVWSLCMVKLWFLLTLLWLSALCFLVNWGWIWMEELARLWYLHNAPFFFLWTLNMDGNSL